jgi:hypothetical protein
VLSDLPVSGALANCCAPESITNALPQLAQTGMKYFGGYANTFQFWKWKNYKITLSFVHYI